VVNTLHRVYSCLGKYPIEERRFVDDRVISRGIVLNRSQAKRTLKQLRPLHQNVVAQRLRLRVLQTWNSKRENGQIVLSLHPLEIEVLKGVGAKAGIKVVRYRYRATYRHPHSSTEVIVKSEDIPSRRRAFKVPGRGNRKFRRVKLYRVKQPKESIEVAKSKKTKNAKAAEAEADSDDDLEGLEELEELEEEEEPEAVDEDEEEEKPKRKRRTRTKAKKGKKKAPAKDEDDEDDEEEEEDEDEEEEEEEKPKKRKRSSKAKDKAAEKGAKKSKAKAKDKEKGENAAGRTTKDMTGGVGSAELAEAASEIADAEITGRDVRVYLRKNEIEKDEDHNRYVWPSEKNKEFKKLAKDIAKEYADEE